VSFLPTRSGILKTYLSCSISGCVFDMQPVSTFLIVAHIIPVFDAKIQPVIGLSMS